MMNELVGEVTTGFVTFVMVKVRFVVADTIELS